MVLRLVFKSEIDAARESISKLAIGRRLREGRTLVVEAGSSTAAAFRFAIGAATALAAGFLLSLGLDAVVLIGKWEILLAIVFYTGVVWALVSPVLLIPRTAVGVAKALERVNRLAAEERLQAQSADKRAEIERLKTNLESAIKVHASKTSNWPKFLRKQVAIDEEEEAADQVSEIQRSLAALGAEESPSEPSITSSIGSRLLRAASLLLYFAIFCFASWWMLGPVAALVLAVLSALIFFLSRTFGVEAVLPLAMVIVIILGYGLGERFQDLPLSATIETDRESLTARIVASTSTELIVLTTTGNGKRRSVAMVPRSVVRKVTIDQAGGFSSTLQLLPKLSRD